MKQKILIVSILISSLLLLAGCWNRRELNDLSIVVGMGIDRSDGHYAVSLQIVLPEEIAAKGGSSGRVPVVIYQEKGKTIFEAIRKITTIAPRKLYFAHLRILVLGEDLAKEGIGETLDFLLRDPEVRSDFYITVSKDSKAKDVLKVLTMVDKIPANELFASLEAAEKAWAPTNTVTLDKLTSDIVSDGISAILTGIEIVDDAKEGEEQANLQKTDDFTKLKYQGIGVFKDDKLIGWLNDTESIGLNYLTGKIKSTITNISCLEKGIVGIEVIRTKTDLKAGMHKNNPKGIVKIDVEANVGDVECKTLDLSKTETINYLEEKTASKIKSDIDKAIKVSQERYATDIFGFGEAIHRQFPNYWKKHKKNWNQVFVNMPIEIDVNVKIRQIGTIHNFPFNKSGE